MSASRRTISGIVLDEAGKPVKEARVYLTEGPQPFADIAALTAPDGRFTLATPSEGDYTVECTAEGRRPVSRAVNVGARETAMIELRLKKGE